MEEQNNSEYIYAGKIERNSNGRYVADSYVCIDPESGLTRKQMFEQSLSDIINANEENEPNLKKDNENNTENNFENTKTDSNSKSIKGKNYAISDIHGMYGSYIEVVSKLKPEDTLYIVGDVIDRGPNGIKIIMDIIEKQADTQNNPNIVFLCGNHEWEFYKNIERFFNGIDLLSTEELATCSDRKRANILCKYLELRNLSHESKVKVQNMVEKLKEEKKQGKLART